VPPPSSRDTSVADALEAFRARAALARTELAGIAYTRAGDGLPLDRLAAIVRLEGYFEGYLEALKLAPAEVAAKCVPEARSLVRDLTAILFTSG